MPKSPHARRLALTLALACALGGLPAMTASGSVPAGSIDGGRFWRDPGTGILLSKPATDFHRNPVLVQAAERIGKAAKAAGVPIVFAYVPRKQEALRSRIPDTWNMKPTDRAKANLLAAYGKAGQALDLTPVVANRPSYWFKTDHHWNHRGAAKATDAIIEALRDAGVPVGPARGTFRIRSNYPPFFGSSARTLGLRSAKSADRFVVPVSSVRMSRCTGSNFSNLACGLPVYAQSAARSSYPYSTRYSVYLGGDRGVTVINGGGTGTLLMTKDSFGSPVATMLAPRFKRIIAIDERHYTGSKLSRLIKRFKPDGLLMLHSSTVMHGPDWHAEIWS